MEDDKLHELQALIRSQRAKVFVEPNGTMLLYGLVVA